MKKSFDEIVGDIQFILDNTDWHQTQPEPYCTILMIEAKAKLMEAQKKIQKVIAIHTE